MPLPYCAEADEHHRSRDATSHPSYGNERIVRRERRMDSIRTSQFPIRKGTKRAAKNERRWWCLRFRLRHERKYRRRNADRRNFSFCRGFGHGRAWNARRTSIGVPPRFWLRRPNATAQLQSALPGMGRKRALSANRPVSVQRSSSQTGHSAGRAGKRSRPGAGCNSARGHPLAPHCGLPTAARPIGRGSEHV
jgi:hypothetical protein